jgi:hypothetical protein
LLAPKLTNFDSKNTTMALFAAHQRTLRPAAASRGRCVKVAAVHRPDTASSLIAAAAAALLVSWRGKVVQQTDVHMVASGVRRNPNYRPSPSAMGKTSAVA